MANGLPNKPVIDHKKCTACRFCIIQCPELCITKNEKIKEIEIDYDFCKMCGICVMICPKRAIKIETPQ
jgi:2-oxoacid:acceptor oxidoreductase delta subunit (pyruvate/2-ketoisovalerate family)